MLVIGLTGGIGSGKSTVAELFAKRGAPIIDADVVARVITQPNTSAFKKIVEHFGPQIVLSDGNLDRKQLRNIIFADSKQRHWLEQLLHPQIHDDILQQLHKLSAHAYCIVVIPLLIEAASYAFLDRILVVDATQSLQIERVNHRDKLERHHIEAILNTQATREHRLSQADDVITNTGEIAELEPQVARLHERYLELAEMR